VVTLLRNGTGYDGPPFTGPIFTDDLPTMKAITDHYSVADAALKSLQAGDDTALWMSTCGVDAVAIRLSGRRFEPCQYRCFGTKNGKGQGGLRLSLQSLTPAVARWRGDSVNWRRTPSRCRSLSRTTQSPSQGYSAILSRW
jgi:hypothetical protein